MSAPDWTMYDDSRENSTGRYFVLSERTKGEAMKLVTVKHSTRHDKMACFTCKTADCCPHAAFVREYVEQMAEHVEESAAV
jgi:hypothetical protein